MNNTPGRMQAGRSGLHHVTALAGAVAALDGFYGGVLRQELVKRTVNHDDPRTWHLYYGRDGGKPGTVSTFFPWGADAPPGHPGRGQATVVRYAAGEGEFHRWRQLVGQAGGDREPFEVFGEPVVPWHDPDGLRVEMVLQAGLPAGVVQLHSVVLRVERTEPTARILRDYCGFSAEVERGAMTRFRAPGEGGGRVVDLLAASDSPRGRYGRGTLHHVAFRVPNEALLADLRQRLISEGFAISGVVDRTYFRSVYFREPGGVLFELATDDPGFAVDESGGPTGHRLCLPDWLEPLRADFEQRWAAER